MTDLPKLIDTLSALRPSEAAELAGLLEKRWGVSAVPAGATPDMAAGPRNWMNLTEAQVNFGLVQRGIVSINFATREPNQAAPPGMAAAIGTLSDALRPSFLAWWRTGWVHDVSEPRGMSLRKLMDGAYLHRMSAAGAFMSMDHVLKDPGAWDRIAKDISAGGLLP